MQFPEWPGGEFPSPRRPTTEPDFLKALSRRVDGSGSYTPHGLSDNKNKQGDLGNMGSSKGLSTGGIIAIILAFVVFVGFMAVIILWLRQRAGGRRPKKNWTTTDVEMDDKDFDRAEDMRRRDEEESTSRAPPPTYQLATTLR